LLVITMFRCLMLAKEKRIVVSEVVTYRNGL
jgi:hypothetical protein